MGSIIMKSDRMAVGIPAVQLVGEQPNRKRLRINKEDATKRIMVGLSEDDVTNGYRCQVIGIGQPDLVLTSEESGPDLGKAWWVSSPDGATYVSFEEDVVSI